jgi:hypothetical protein
MAVYYIEPKTNRAGQTIGFSEIKEKKSTKVPEGAIKIDMNGIKYKDYKSNMKNYYLSGNVLTEVIKNENPED